MVAKGTWLPRVAPAPLSSSYKSEATGMTNWEYQDGRHGGY